MRAKEVKYRVFSKETGEMIDWKQILASPALVDYLKTPHDGDAYHSPLMRYIHLIDKNAVQIYDGDVVKITNTERFLEGENITCISDVQVIDGHPYVWVDPVIYGVRSRRGSKLLFGGSGHRIGDRGVATQDIEVIGNIYEHPDLVTY